MARWYDFYNYTPSRPREAKGGIKAQSRRGGFATNWWAKKWIAVLEGFNIGARLHRGQSYARQGQVLSVEIEKGLVTAKVQGSRAKPYQVKIQVAVLSRKDWEKLAEAFSQQAIFGAKLLAGEMPESIEGVFKDTGFSLFPSRKDDLKTECSCPDWSNPCKHIAAVYYLLGEEFDRDPFLIFRLRGMEREELTALMGGRIKAPRTEGMDEVRLPPEPLPLEPSAFWGEDSAAEINGEEINIPSVPASLAKRLGNFPFWRGNESFICALEAVCRAASQSTLRILSRDTGKGD